MPVLSTVKYSAHYSKKNISMFKNCNYQKENLMLCVVLLIKAVIKKTDDLKITVDSDISRSDSDSNIL